MNLGAPCVGVTRGSSLFCWGAAISAVFYFAEGAVVEFSFYGIQIIELKFTIDKHTACMVALPVLSRTNLAERTSLTSSISFISIRLQPLCRLQKKSPLCNQANPASFCKTPGGGGTQHFRAELRFRRHMPHVAPLSPVPSLDRAYFLSPPGCTSLCGN